MSCWLIGSVLVNPPEHAQHTRTHERAEALGRLWVKIKEIREGAKKGDGRILAAQPGLGR